MRRGDTLFLNAAYVPRVRHTENGDELSYFLRTRWQAGECMGVEEVWVDVHGDESEASTPVFVDLDPEAPTFDERHDGEEEQ